MRSALTVLLAVSLAGMLVAATPSRAVTFGQTSIGNGIILHYAEQGHGTPLVFVHGSLSDYSYWKDEVGTFSSSYRAIAYSRRYNWPNHNPAQPGYSAIVDADDFAAFDKALHLGPVILVGHSYGALTALFVAIRHPEMVSALILAEPPAISLLNEMPGRDAEKARAMYADIAQRMVAPMKRDFARHDREAGVADFIDYVFQSPDAWRKMSVASREETMRDAHEWDVMMTTGELFPYVDPNAVRHIHIPILLLTGNKTYPFLTLIDHELMRLLPNNQNLVIKGAGHQMFYQQTQVCDAAIKTFLRWAHH